MYTILYSNPAAPPPLNESDTNCSKHFPLDPLDPYIRTCIKTLSLPTLSTLKFQKIRKEREATAVVRFGYRLCAKNDTRAHSHTRTQTEQKAHTPFRSASINNSLYKNNKRIKQTKKNHSRYLKHASSFIREAKEKRVKKPTKKSE